MPTPHLSKELQEVFDREEKLTPIMHQQALAIFDQLATDLHRLRDRLEPELFNQELTDGINPNSAPSSGGKIGCTEPATPFYRTRFSTKAALDNWYKAQIDRLSGIRKDLDQWYTLPRRPQNPRLDSNLRSKSSEERNHLLLVSISSYCACALWLVGG